MSSLDQIRIRIIEARQLPGNNIKPVVKVQACRQTHRTRIKRGNNPFFDEVLQIIIYIERFQLFLTHFAFEQMFFYNVHMLPSDLFEQNISFRVSRPKWASLPAVKVESFWVVDFLYLFIFPLLQVYNSYSLRADSLMGEFKVPMWIDMDLKVSVVVLTFFVFLHSLTSAMCMMKQVSLWRTTPLHIPSLKCTRGGGKSQCIFKVAQFIQCSHSDDVRVLIASCAAGHCVMRKWLLLNDPDDSSSGAKGYLKVSLFVVGIGDEQPVRKQESLFDVFLSFCHAKKFFCLFPRPHPVGKEGIRRRPRWHRKQPAASSRCHFTMGHVIAEGV